MMKKKCNTFYQTLRISNVSFFVFAIPFRFAADQRLGDQISLAFTIKIKLDYNEQNGAEFVKVEKNENCLFLKAIFHLQFKPFNSFCFNLAILANI